MSVEQNMENGLVERASEAIPLLPLPSTPAQTTSAPLSPRSSVAMSKKSYSAESIIINGVQSELEGRIPDVVMNDCETKYEAVSQKSEKRDSSVIGENDTHDDSPPKDIKRINQSELERMPPFVVMNDCETKYEAVSQRSEKRDSSVIGENDTHDDSPPKDIKRINQSELERMPPFVVMNDCETNYEAVSQRSEKRDSSVIGENDTHDDSPPKDIKRINQSELERMPPFVVMNDCETNYEAVSQRSEKRDSSVIGENDTHDDSPSKDIKAMDWTLREAVRHRDVQTVKRLLAAGASLTCRDAKQMTPLHLSIQQYCYWSYEHKVPRTNCLPVEMKIIQETLAAGERAENKNDILNSRDEKGRSPLYLAIECNFFEVVQALINSGANVVSVSDKNETALHVAAQRPEILKYFLNHYDIENSVDKEGYAAIHAATKFDEIESFVLLINQFGQQQLTWYTFDGSTVLHVAAENGSIEVAKVLLRNLYQSNLHVDNNGETPLNRSAKHGHKALTALLLNHGAVLSDKGHHGRTAVEQIARRFADPLKFFEDVFDEFIIENDSSAMCKERKVHVDYKVLANSDGRGMSQIKVIEELVSCGLSELLIHPLIESLLYLKWRCLLPVVYTIIAIYALFLISFNAFLVTAFYRRDYDSSNCSTPLNSTERQCQKCFDGWDDWLWITLIYLSICLLLVQECVYIYLQRRRYFDHRESWVKLLMLVLAAVVPLGVRCGEPAPWLRHVCCVALLLSWLQAMFLLSRFPDWGYYVLMFERVAYNIFKILLTSICLVIGFSFCFMIQYRSESPFDGPSAAFVKTLVMMSSEFDYGDLFADTHDDALKHTKAVVRLLFVIFVIFIAIVLMNFMIGVAVSDINELNTIGNIRRLEMQVELQSTLDVLVDTVLLKLFKRLSRIKFHHNISKDIESDEKWKVWYGIYSYNVDNYEQCLTTDLQNAIIDVAKRKAQRKNDNDKKNEKKNKLDVMYNTLIKLPPYLEHNRQADESNASDDLILRKEQEPSHSTLNNKNKLLVNSNQEIKQSIDELKEHVNKILTYMTRGATSYDKRGYRETW